MTAINHALTGTVIGLVVGEPWLAIPLAVASHFICDALPHFGTGLPDKVVLRTNKYRNYLIIETTLCFLLVIAIASLQPAHWLLAAICAFAAAAPDLASINRYLAIRRGRAWQAGSYVRFAKSVQWFERPVGAVVEVAWFCAAIILLLPFLR